MPLVRRIQALVCQLSTGVASESDRGQGEQEVTGQRVDERLVHPAKLSQLVVDGLPFPQFHAGRRQLCAKPLQLIRRQSIGVWLDRRDEVNLRQVHDGVPGGREG